MKVFLYKHRIILAGSLAWGIGILLVLMLSGCATTNNKTVCVRKADQAYEYYVSKGIPVRYIHGWIREAVQSGRDKGKRTMVFKRHAWVEYYDKKTNTWLLRDIGFGYRDFPRESYKIKGKPEYKFDVIIKEMNGKKTCL